MNDLAKAEYNLKRSCAYPERGFNAHYYLALIYEKQGKNDLAKAEYQKYIDSGLASASGLATAQKRIAALGGAASTPNAAAKPAAPAAGMYTQEMADSIAALQKKLEAMTTQREKDSIAAHIESLKNKPLTVGPTKMATLEMGKTFAFASPSEVGGTELQTALNLIQKKSWNSAIEVLQKLRAKYPNTPNAAAAAHNIGFLYSYLGLDSLNVVFLRGALREGPPEPYLSSIKYQLAQSKLRTRNYPEATRDLSEVQSGGTLGPTESQKKALAADIAAQYKPDKGSVDLMLQAIETESDPQKKAALQLKLASLYLDLGDEAKASDTYRSILDACATEDAGPREACRKSIFELGNKSYRDRNYPRALEYYQRAIAEFKSKEDTPWAMYQVGNIFRLQRNYKEAVAAYDALIKEYSGSYWADQAKWNRDDALWQQDNRTVLEK
jgi:tetratricopeptide (TPR) repeat protein